MSFYYFDSSALVKYYLREPGSTWVKQIVDAQDEHTHPLHAIYVTALAKVEVTAAIALVRRSGRISERVRVGALSEFTNNAPARYQFIPMSDALLQEAAQHTQTHALKAYDAIHLATALALRVRLARRRLSLAFICADARLLKVAASVGLATDDPFLHTDRDSPL